jgi:hypothetical protein
MLDWECERPFFPKRTDLLACFLDAALSFNLMWRCHPPSRFSETT